MYKTVYEKGKAYLASLYDQDGNPTTENKAEHQDTVEQYAEELLAAAGVWTLFTTAAMR